MKTGMLLASLMLVLVLAGCVSDGLSDRQLAQQTELMNQCVTAVRRSELEAGAVGKSNAQQACYLWSREQVKPVAMKRTR